MYVKVIFEQSAEGKVPLHLVFVDIERAFVSLQHTAIWQFIANLPTKLLNFIKPTRGRKLERLI